MSQEVFGFAERCFSISPRPAALQIETILSHFVLLDILVQTGLLGYMILDDFICAPLGAAMTKEDVPAYVGQVCGTQIRINASGFYIQKSVFLTFFLLIFYFNKVMVNRLNRYHAILMREKLPAYLSMEPIYKNVNYYLRWKQQLIFFFIYKLFCFICLTIGVVSAQLIFSMIPPVAALLSFRGVPCGKKMLAVPELDQVYSCHLEHEFMIKCLSILSTTLAVLIWLTMGASIFALFYYSIRFKKERALVNHLDSDLTPYISYFDGDEYEESFNNKSDSL